MNDIFIAIIVALILLIIGYVFQTKTEIKNENNKNIVKSRLDWLQNLKKNFSSYNENLNNILKLKNPKEAEFKDLFVNLENNVNKIQQEFKPYSYDTKQKAFTLSKHSESDEIPDILSYIEEGKGFASKNNQIETASETEVDLELFLMLMLNEVNSRMKPHTDHSSTEIQTHSDDVYTKLWSYLELYQELILEVQKLIIKIEWERIKKDSDSGYKVQNLNKLIEKNINRIAVSYNEKIDVGEDNSNDGKTDDLSEDKSILANDKLIEIKKGTVFGILAETINEIYKENNKIDYMTTSTGQRYIYTTVKGASHPNGKLFGNKKELHLPLEEDTTKDIFLMKKEKSENIVYVETNFSKAYAENLSEFMKREAGIK